MKQLIGLLMLGVVVQMSIAEVEPDQDKELEPAPNKKDVIFEIMKKFYNSKLTNVSESEVGEKPIQLNGEELTLAYLKKTEQNWANLQQSINDFKTTFGSLPERITRVHNELKELVNDFNFTTQKP
ncbi:uncharacterized protein LOC113564855 [Drosophila erecta]|uniref:uncharacterized protein LOC113564855 n=1 Tax=Drosophila erecta TaxID=7220 RepID=UPI000F05F311|nr:uncharacterized protein LOC113564855 [Drosophila erecta]